MLILGVDKMQKLSLDRQSCSILKIESLFLIFNFPRTSLCLGSLHPSLSGLFGFVLEKK